MTVSFSNCNRIQKDYNQVITGNKSLLRSILARNNRVKCTWVPGHQNFQINEQADSVAKDAARKCSPENAKTPDRRNLLMMIKEDVVKNNWKFRVDQSLSDHRVHAINPRAGQWKSHKALMGHPMYKTMKQLISGHHGLNAYNSMITGRSPKCKCGQPETLDHLLFYCERYSRSRFVWAKEVSNVLEDRSVPLRCVSWETLFGQRKDAKVGTDQNLCLALLNFLKNTKRFNY